jgi:DNA repair REX1-B
MLHRGLGDIIQTGNMTNYPAICAEVTASFAVLSETINAVQKALADRHDRKDLAALISRLQKGEKEKLSLTAALHLESIRAQTQRQLDEQIMETADTRISSLLQQGVSSLQQLIAAAVEEINEVLEELRFALIEEESD